LQIFSGFGTYFESSFMQPRNKIHACGLRGIAGRNSLGENKMNAPLSSSDAPNLDGELLLAQLRKLGAVGIDVEIGGRTRIALTDEERAGRDLVVSWMRELDLDIQVDRIGNIFGTLRSQSDDGSQRPLMIGSHIDTVKNAGSLDGCYGVLAGLAVARAFRSAGILPLRSITVAAFTNEEGVRYQPDMMGSLVCAGGLTAEEALNTIGIDGTRLGDELERIGYAGHLEPGAIVPHEYLELHIEQGPILEAEDLRIGVVENLQGISWQQVLVQGTANHAGTTPTRLRHDAGYVAAAVQTFLRDLALSTGTTLATTGMLKVEPNVINVIPRKAIFTVDLRDPDEQRLQNAEARLEEFLAQIAEKEGVEISTERLARFEPVIFNPELVDAIEASAEKMNFSHKRMTSGAGHDAQMIARIAPSAMIFVPSRGGISHNPREHTDDDQLVNGANVLLDVVVKRLAA
jgi:beta-ureidopropionase / N-carbamoyl-L-amino-acid hydrolase